MSYHCCHGLGPFVYGEHCPLNHGADGLGLRDTPSGLWRLPDGAIACNINAPCAERRFHAGGATERTHRYRLSRPRIEAFGEFVVGGSYAVGLVLFTILVVINFVVVTKGATRVSEVTARFTLDAMPGKQMAIDADLNAV